MSATACVLAIHLAGGDAAHTLTELSHQTHIQLLFDSEVARGNPTPALDACFDSAGEAFEAFLKNTKFDWSAVSARTFIVKPRCPAGTWVKVPAGDAAYTLDNLGIQVPVRLQFERNVVAGRSTQAIGGCYHVDQALTAVLKGTDLTWTLANADTFHIQLRRSRGFRPTGAGKRSSSRPVTPDVAPLVREASTASSAPSEPKSSSMPVKDESRPRVLVRGYANEFQSTDYDYHRDWACTPEGPVERCVLRHPL